MRCSIVFSSVTGNTRQLADAVFSVLPQKSLRCFGSPAEIALEANRLYIGFGRTKDIATFLKEPRDKEFFLFGTAGFSGSQAYVNKILASVQKHIDCSNTVVGTFMCQGKMPVFVRERYMKMKNSPIPKR